MVWRTSLEQPRRDETDGCEPRTLGVAQPVVDTQGSRSRSVEGVRLGEDAPR